MCMIVTQSLIHSHGTFLVLYPRNILCLHISGIQHSTTLVLRIGLWTGGQQPCKSYSLSFNPILLNGRRDYEGGASFQGEIRLPYPNR